MKKEGLNEPEAPFVLCLGQDAWLLRTRRDVVATQYRAQAFEYLHELYALGPEVQVDLVLLCHTVPEAQRVAVRYFAQQRWPAVKILQIRSPASDWLDDQSFPSQRIGPQPATLLRSLAEALQQATPASPAAMHPGQ